MRFCRWCAQPTDRCDESCRSGGEAPEAPRFCPVCRRRLTRYVTPGSFVVRCRDHGEA